MRTERSLWKRAILQWDIQIMIIPGILLILLFHYVPMYGILTAFENYNLFKGVFGSHWVGFGQFLTFFHSQEFWNIMRNTIVISLLKLAIGFPAPIILALMLNEIKAMAFKRVIQTISYLPHFLSWVIVAGFATSMLAIHNGSVNMLLIQSQLIHEPINWLSIPKYFWSILISANVWKNIGFGSIIYLAAISGVDPHLYEASSIDGASKWKQIFTITLPSIMPIIVIFLILAIGNILNAGFEDILLLARNPILWSVSDVIDTYVYRMGIIDSRYSYATAVGLFKAVISIGLLAFANTVARKTGNSLW